MLTIIPYSQYSWVKGPPEADRWCRSLINTRSLPIPREPREKVLELLVESQIIQGMFLK